MTDIEVWLLQLGERPLEEIQQAYRKLLGPDEIPDSEVDRRREYVIELKIIRAD